MKTQGELFSDIETELRLIRTRTLDIIRNIDRAEVYMKNIKEGMKDEKLE